MELFISVFFSVLVAWALVAPHLRPATTAQNLDALGGVLNALLEQKTRCMQLLKDLELDFSTGKLSDSDYSRMRDTLTAELAQLLTRIDECRAS